MKCGGGVGVQKEDKQKDARGGEISGMATHWGGGNKASLVEGAGKRRISNYR